MNLRKTFLQTIITVVTLRLRLHLSEWSLSYSDFTNVTLAYEDTSQTNAHKLRNTGIVVIYYSSLVEVEMK